MDGYGEEGQETTSPPSPPQVVVPYHAISMPGSDNLVLNSGHSFFLLVDDGSVGRFGCEMLLRKNFEKYLSQQRISSRRWLGLMGEGVGVLLGVMVLGDDDDDVRDVCWGD